MTRKNRKNLENILLVLAILSFAAMLGMIIYSAYTNSLTFFWAGWAMLLPTAALIATGSNMSSSRIDLGLGIEDDLGLNPPRRAKAKARARHK